MQSYATFKDEELITLSTRNSDQPLNLSTDNTLHSENDTTSSAILDAESEFTSFNAIDSSKIRNSTINNKQDSSDMWFKIFIEVLLRMNPMLTIYTKQCLIDYCESLDINNEDDKKIIDEIKMESDPSEQAVRWYTSHTFLYKKLNICLRKFQIDDIFNLQYFIVSLHNQLKKLHAEQLEEKQLLTLTVYRGEQLTPDHLARIEQNKGGLLTMNRFVSTSRHFAQAKSYAKLAKSNRVGVIFEILIDCKRSTQPFADISKLSVYPLEEEILFSVATVFRIKSIHEKENICCITLLLSNDVDEEHEELTEFIMKEKLHDTTNLSHLIQLMMYMDDFQRALQYCNMVAQWSPARINKDGVLEVTMMLSPLDIGTNLYNKGQAYNGLGCIDEALECLEQANNMWLLVLEPNDEHFSKLYSSLGSTYRMKAKYEVAVQFFKKSIENYESRDALLNNAGASVVYCNMGLTYTDMNDYPNALTYLMKAIEIQETLPKNHYDLAASYHNIAIVYSRIGELKRAIEYFEKTREIFTVIYEENHPRFGVLYNCMGKAYYRLGDSKTCIEYYKTALRIQTNVLTTSRYSDIVLSDTYNNLGEAYASINDLQTALGYQKEAEKLKERSLPYNHTSLIETYNSISSIYRAMKDYSNALSYHHRALEILEKTVLSDHEQLADVYSNTGLTYYQKEEYSTALKYYKKAEEIRNTISSNRHELAKIYSKIASLYDSMKEYLNALSYFDKERQMQETYLPPDHPYLGRIYVKMGILYMNAKEYSNSVLYCEKARKIWEQSYPSQHPGLATLYFILGTTYRLMNNNITALLWMKKAHDIQQTTDCPEIPPPSVMETLIVTILQDLENCQA
ncbi:unnamed protein product [Rotaria sp. Silwood2]|nr:unnamed protein product [Rotaria sp. Silwood2]CAF4547543.1 unnamed protein product [Rotaria sp. Silwood2]